MSARQQHHRIKRRCALAALATMVLGAALTGCGSSSSVEATDEPIAELRIGVQKSSLLLNLLRSNGALESRLGPRVRVTWKEFPAGPQLLEAIHVGAVDFGHAGETPPVFAQAAGVDLVYVACEQESPQSEAILVLEGSPIRSLADLQGKRIALNKGSNVHYLLLRALDRAGLEYGDVRPVFLPPADARAAFENGSVDAWVIWDPYLAAAESAGARVLTDGTGLVDNRGFYLAARRLAQQQPAALALLVEELATTSEWVSQNRPATVDFIATLLGMEPAIIEKAERRRSYGIVPLDASVVQAQQRVATAFLQAQLIPHPIEVADAIWKPVP